VKFSNVVSIQIFSVKKCKPLFLRKTCRKRLLPIAFQVRDVYIYPPRQASCCVAHWYGQRAWITDKPRSHASTIGPMYVPAFSCVHQHFHACTKVSRRAQCVPGRAYSDPMSILHISMRVIAFPTNEPTSQWPNLILNARHPWVYLFMPLIPAAINMEQFKLQWCAMS
jgi:hypothetical protein